jgi:hypothetical protein
LATEASAARSIEGIELLGDAVDTNIVNFTVDPALGTAAEFCEQRARRSERAWGAVRAVLLVVIVGIMAGIVEFLVFRSIYDFQNVVLHLLPSGKWP